MSRVDFRRLGEFKIVPLLLVLFYTKSVKQGG